MVLKKAEAEEVFKIAESKKLVLMEALKTAYAPGFTKLVSNAKSGSIGRICDVEAAFTKLVPHSSAREFSYEENGGSFTELGSYPLLAITKILGRNYQDIKFISFVDKNGVDL
jgi:predicted dehydrogenase